MISKNFDFLKNYDNYKLLYNDLSILEDELKLNDYEKTKMIVSQILKKILIQVMKSKNTNESVEDLFDDFKNFYKEEKNSYLNIKIISSLKWIISLINQIDLSKNTSSLNDVENFYTTSISILQNLRTIIYFIIKEFEDYKIDINKFDDDIYYFSTNKTSKIDLKTEYHYDNNQINIDKICIGDFILNLNNNFVIPPYQRDYCWKIDECQELWNQLIYKCETEELVYLGTIACKIKKTDDNENEIKLIDGQQRITTSLIFFKAFFDVIKLKVDSYSEIPKELRNLFMAKEDNKYLIEKKYNNLTNIEKNFRKSLQSILRFYDNSESEIKKFEQENRENGKSNLYMNYTFFKKTLEEKTLEQIIWLYNYYYNNFVVSVIRFDNKKTNEMEVFENLNAKGVSLETFDMIKNFMLNMVDEKVFKDKPQEVVDEFLQYFNINNIPKFKGNDSEKNKKYEEFFFNFLSYKATESSDFKGNISKNKRSLLNAFKQFYNKKNITFDEYAYICEELGRYFAIYKKIRLTNEYQQNSSEFYFARNVILNIAHKDLSIIYFKLIDIFSHKEWDKDAKKIRLLNESIFLKCLFEIEKWLLFYIQVKGTGQSFKDPVYKKYIKFINEYKQYHNYLEKLPEMTKNYFRKTNVITKFNMDLLIDDKYVLPSKEAILESLKTTDIQDKEIISAFLRGINNFVNNYPTKSNAEYFIPNPTIEHIIPQKLSKDWLAYLAKVENLTNDQVQQKHKEYINKLGNLLILDKENNSEISNKIFAEKQKNYKNSNIALATIQFSINDESLLNIKDFGFTQVNDRSVALAKILIEKVYEID